VTEHKEAEAARTSNRPYQVRLPGFVSDEDIGLGDVVKRVGYAFGVRTCGGCERRAALLNHWVRFVGRSK
jgi:hypothetical protein